ncbi:MAG: hypothetical protein NTZ03_01885 [Actinobacteria bacterium]|nr:hypothetical protein [Actinomycetota bacterium]
MSETATESTETPVVKRPRKSRSIVAVVFFVIAALLLPLGLTAFWAQRTITETTQYIETVTPLSSDPAIQDTVATIVSEQVTSAIDVSAALAKVLPPAGQALVGPLTSAIDNLLDRAVLKVMQSAAFQKAWVVFNTAAQKSLVTLLEGKPDGPLQVDKNGTVLLDTTALYQAVRQRMVDDGVSFASKLPETPPKDKQIVLLQSDQLAQAQAIYSVTHPVSTWTLWVAIALFILAIILARRRARMVLAVGLAVLVGAVLLRVGLSIGESQVQLALQNTPLAAAEAAFFTTLTRFLTNGIEWMLGIGIAMAVLGWLFGQSAPAAKIRSWTRADVESAEGSGFAGWLRRYGRLLALAIGVSAIVIILALSLTLGQLLIVSVSLIVIGVLLWFGLGKPKDAVLE